jgi:uncharacterized protein YjbI with pentapeptide repeats
MEVLSAYVRENAPTAAFAPEYDLGGDDAEDVPTPRVDIQAALTVIGRRRERLDRERIDLRNADIRGYSLTKARLTGADLQGADLKQVNLQEATLVVAELENSDLRDELGTLTFNLSSDQLR